MRFEAFEVRLKDGRTAQIRPPRAEDAQPLIDCRRALAGETRFLTQAPEEVRRTEAIEREIIDDINDDPRGAMLLAFVDGECAGSCALSRVRGAGRRTEHRCTLGVGLYQRFCGLGLGRSMLEHALDLAANCGYEQAELEVAAGNEIAVALYEKLGFVRYGRRPREMKFADGSYADALLMAKRL